MCLQLSLISDQYLLCLHDADNPPITFLYNGDSLPAPSNLTRNYATDVPQSSNGITSYIMELYHEIMLKVVYFHTLT